MSRAVERVVESLLAYALELPEAWEDHPWGENVAKVGKKVFVFFGTGDLPRDEFGFCVKLPDSGREARLLPFVEPATYGLGKHGWVNVKIGVKQAGMLETFRGWIEESYRAVAPKKLIKELDAGAAPAPALKKKVAARKKPGTRKPAAARKRPTD